MSSTGAIEVDSTVEAAYKDVRTDSSTTDWFVCGYETKTKIVVQQQGSGSLDDMFSHFADNQCHFAFARITTGDSQSKRIKFAFFSWCGPDVSVLAKAKISVHKAEVKKVIRDFAREFHFDNKSEINSESVIADVRKAGGANYTRADGTN